MSQTRHTTIPETLFVNEVRLGARSWALVAALVLAVVAPTPPVWRRVERFDPGQDYRIPYALSKDYWLYERRLDQVTDPRTVLVLGDSVVWGEYVLPDGTLSHFLSADRGQPGGFVNAGVNGLFPLALEGLVDHYSPAVHGRKVLLHCNVLWMSSPKADLQVDKEERFNHVGLVPQFSPRIPCYRADANARLSILVERQLPFLKWVNHLQNAYFDQKSIPQWTLADDGGDPPHYPNSYRNPLAAITLRVPDAPSLDPQRGPTSARHRPWTAAGNGPTRFDWVALDTSLQWAAFQRVVGRLQARGNEVMVVVGPFNEHMIAADNRAAFLHLRDGIVAWLRAQQVPFVAPDPLPSPLYADASHPLTEGYALLAERLLATPTFARWVGAGR